MKNPWEINPKLKKEYIDKTAQLIYQARNNCLDHIELGHGDNNWTHGCRACIWCRQAIKDVAGNGDFPFLSIIKDQQTFVFGISGIPMKFYKDTAFKPSPRVKSQSISEISQLSLFEFAGYPISTDLKWRFITETVEYEITAIKFIGLDKNGELISHYQVPVNDYVSKVYSPFANLEEAVNLSSAPISLKAKTKIKHEAS